MSDTSASVYEMAVERWREEAKVARAESARLRAQLAERDARIRHLEEQLARAVHP